MSDWWSRREGESDRMRRDLDSEYDRMVRTPRKRVKKDAEKKAEIEGKNHDK